MRAGKLGTYLKGFSFVLASAASAVVGAAILFGWSSLKHEYRMWRVPDISEYAEKMFNAKSDISHFSAAELLRMDSKIYEIKGQNTRVSVLETTNPNLVLEKYDDIILAIPKVAKLIPSTIPFAWLILELHNISVK